MQNSANQRSICNRRYSSLVLFLVCTLAMLAFLNQPVENSWRQRQNGNRKIFPITDLTKGQNKHNTEFWNSFTPSFNCPPESLVRIGSTGDGGKWTCGINYLSALTLRSKPEACVLYSFGVAGDSSFEAEMLATTVCKVYAYDPSVNKIAQPLKTTNPRVHFEKLGIAGRDRDNLYTLKTFMNRNGGHEWIDVLKLDVEYAEFETLENILETFEELLFGQLLIEFHFHDRGNEQKTSNWILSLIARLENRGLRLFYKENNPRADDACEFSFINVNVLGEFLSNEDVKKVIERYNHAGADIQQ